MTIKSMLLVVVAVGILVLGRYIKKRGWIVNKALSFLVQGLLRLVMVGLIGAAVLFPGFEKLKTTGVHEVMMETLEVTDDSRVEGFSQDGGFRSLSLDLYYPSLLEDSSTLAPLVVFSHGGLGVKDSNVSLYEELASHGYFVVSVGHTYHAFETKIGGKSILIDKGYFDEMMKENPNNDIDASFALYQKWMKLRTEDIGFVIDYFMGNGSGKPAATAMIDKEKIGVVGHSLGGAAALGMPRLRSDIDAVIALESPFMVDILDVEKGEFVWNDQPYPVPMLNVYSDSVSPVLDTDRRYAQNKRYALNEDRVAFYHISGSNHYTLTDLSLVSPMICRLLGGSYSLSGQESLETINRLSVDFFDKYLK